MAIKPGSGPAQGPAGRTQPGDARYTLDAAGRPVIRADGTWIWTDTVTYYLRAYGLAPDQELLAHIRRRGYRVAALDKRRHRALVELMRPVGQPS